MKKQICIFFILIAGLLPMWAQTTLMPGDLAFIGMNSDGDQDQFAFVLLESVAAGTSVSFTDCGWSHSTGFNAIDVESHIVWTTANAITTGTIVVVTTYNGTSIPTASIGTITGDNMLISIAGDQVFAYQGTKTAPAFIAAISFNQNSAIQPGNDFDGSSVSNSSTALPDGLTMGLNAVHIYANSTFAEQDNSRYAGSLSSGSKLALLRELNKRTNWEMNDLTVFTLNPFPKTFTVSASTLSITPTEATIVSDGGTSIVNVSSNTVWNVSSDKSWLSLSASNGMENGLITLTATVNTGGSRSATVTFSASGVPSKSIVITQQMAPNNVLHFDGTNDFVDLPDLPTSVNFSQGFTFSAWVKWDAFQGNERIFEIGNGNNNLNNSIILRIEGGKGQLRLQGSSGTNENEIITTDDAVTTGKWYHVAVTITTANVGTIYVNGVAVKSGTVYKPLNVVRANNWLGKSAGTTDKYFKGSMDEVSMWSKTLNQTEIAGLMNSNLIGTEAGLAIYYNFNQAVAGGNNAGRTTLVDASTNAFHGTLTNFTLSGSTSNWLDAACKLTVQVGANGAVKENDVTLTNGAILSADRGATKTFVITPAANYAIATLSYNGANVTLPLVGNTYTTPAVTADATLAVTFGLASLTLNVPTAGGLCGLISAADKTTITKLTLTGTINAIDVKYMRDDMTALAVLDLSAVNIAAYTGTEGTISSDETTYPANEMPAYSFRHLTNNTSKLSLTQCIMPNSLTSIGGRAFSRCTGLTGALIIPNSVTTISISAFERCAGFTGNLIIPNAVTTIGNNAFASCTGFTGVLSIPNAVTTISPGAFSRCTGFTGSLIIPNAVTSIGNNAFKDCTGFTGSLIIPNAVTSIGDAAFRDCTGFTGSLIILNAVTSIGDQAFEGCTGFTGSLIIPNAVTSIGDRAFVGCTGFTGLNIPNSVTSIGGQAFNSCKGLTKVSVANSTPPTIIEASTFSNINKASCVLEVPIGAIPAYQANSNWYSSFSIIQEADFFFDITVKVSANGSVKENDVTLINGTILSADRGTTKTFVITPDANYAIATLSYNGANVTLPLVGNTFTTPVVTADARLVVTFGLASLTLNVPTAGGLCGLISADDKNTITNLTLTGTIDARDVKCMRDNMPVLAVIDLSAVNIAAYTGTDGPESTNETAYPANEMPGSSFNYKTALTQCKMPNSLTSIGVSAFSSCSGLTGDLSIPNSVSSIGAGAFYACFGFTGELTISNSVSNIFENTFRGCTRFTGNLIIPNSVTSIGAGAFGGCSGFTGNLSIPNSVTNIGDNAFQGCTGFTGSIFFPNSLTTIGDNAFNYCQGFTKVSVANSTPPTIEANTFANINATCVLEVPTGATSTYQANENWRIWFASIQEAADFAQAHYRSAVASGNWADFTTWQSSLNGIDGWAANTSLTPSSVAASVSIMTGHLVTVAADATASTLTVSPGAKLTLNAGKKLTASTLTLKSDASGTGTFVDNGTFVAATTNVQQYLTAGRNWYMSVPVSTTTSNTVLNGTNAQYWDETNGAWAIATGNLDYKKGYISVNTVTTGIVTFTGTLNTGTIEIPLTRTTGKTKEGFNLIGNPYPSHLAWTADAATAANVMPSIWYRTAVWNASAVPTAKFDYSFQTYNSLGVIGVPASVDAYIPAMQAFWVRVNPSSDGTETLTLNNAMRYNRDSNPLKAPAAKNAQQSVLRLQVSNGVNNDETVIYSNTNASNAYDRYDSPKMMNEQLAVPNIYSTVGAENLVINGMNALNVGVEIPIGFSTQLTDLLTIKANEISNMGEGVKVILKDKLNSLTPEFDLTDGAVYQFKPVVGSTNNRISIIFKASGVVSGLNKPTADSFSISQNNNGQLILNYNEALNNNCSVSVYNAVGQLLITKSINSASTVLDLNATQGVYIFSILNGETKISKKFVIN